MLCDREAVLHALHVIQVHEGLRSAKVRHGPRDRRSRTRELAVADAPECVRLDLACLTSAFAVTHRHSPALSHAVMTRHTPALSHAARAVSAAECEELMGEAAAVDDDGPYPGVVRALRACGADTGTCFFMRSKMVRHW